LSVPETKLRRGNKRGRKQQRPHPFLKWVGGKGQLLAALMERVRAAGDFGRYHEPFVGGGALFFEMHRAGVLGPKHARLSDNNPRLIEAYRAVQTEPESLIKLLADHEAAHNEQYYYEMRATVPDTPVERAARIIYLNKTCFNGLYRENSKGLFNVPIGKYVNPCICDPENLRAVSQALQQAEIEEQPFAAVLDHAVPGDLVYFDPPYHPLSATSSFTSYNNVPFTEETQRELAAVFAKLHERGVKVLLSNSWSPLILEIYAGFQIDEVQATRMVNSNAAKRGKIAEALVRNF